MPKPRGNPYVLFAFPGLCKKFLGQNAVSVWKVAVDVYRPSLTVGCPICIQWLRIWCRRPVRTRTNVIVKVPENSFHKAANVCEHTLKHLKHRQRRWIHVAKLLPAIPANASSLKSLVLDGFPCPPARVGELPFQYSLATDPGMVTAWLHEMV